jgi:AraC-like DNA-binding protein
MTRVLDPDSFQRLCHARDRLREAHDPAPAIPQIAREAGMSLSHFSRVFTALFGETPHRLRTRARLERAKTLLALRNEAVTDVCLDVGFSSLGSFSDLFARRVGASPSRYRRAVQAQMTSPGEWPAEMIPGCLTLMGGAQARDKSRGG